MLQQQLGHVRHNERLRYGLAITYRQSGIFVGPVGERFVDKQVTWNSAHHIQHKFIVDTLLSQPSYQAITSALRSHTNSLVALV
jgi:hypothetical protein